MRVAVFASIGVHSRLKVDSFRDRIYHDAFRYETNWFSFAVLRGTGQKRRSMSFLKVHKQITVHRAPALSSSGFVLLWDCFQLLLSKVQKSQQISCSRDNLEFKWFPSRQIASTPSLNVQTAVSVINFPSNKFPKALVFMNQVVVKKPLRTQRLGG